MSVLTDSFAVEKRGENRYGFPNPLPQGRGVVFGGHLMGNMVAAALQADPGKTVKSATCVLATVVQADQPYECEVDLLRAGRVLSSCSASIVQNGKECARTLLMLTAQEPDLFRHQDEMPEVGRPEEAVAWEDSLGREMRIVGGVDRHDPDVVAPPVLHVWVRYPGAASDWASAQPLVCHATAGFLIGTSMLPHEGIGEKYSHVRYSTGVLGHTVSFHEPVDASQWMLVTQRSTYAGAGRAFGVGQVFTEDGRMVASFSQESLMRPFPEGHSAHGREATVL